MIAQGLSWVSWSLSVVLGTTALYGVCNNKNQNFVIGFAFGWAVLYIASRFAYNEVDEKTRETDKKIGQMHNWWQAQLTSKDAPFITKKLYEDDMKKSEGQINNLTNTISTQNTTINALTNSINGLQQTIQSLKDKNKNDDEIITKQSNQIKELQSEVANFKSALKSSSPNVGLRINTTDRNQLHYQPLSARFNHTPPHNNSHNFNLNSIAGTSLSSLDSTQQLDNTTSYHTPQHEDKKPHFNRARTLSVQMPLSDPPNAKNKGHAYD